MPEEAFELQPFEGEPKKPRGGYAAHPGTGPEGETCGSCRHVTGHRRSRTYYKCGLVQMTFGPGTDIRLKSPACWRWEKEKEVVPEGVSLPCGGEPEQRATRGS